jgi:hypothetical protein
MKAVVLADMLQDVLEVKIRKCRKEMLDTYQQIQVERIQAQIMAYQWVQDRLQDLVTSNSEIRGTRTRT